ncbi:MAG: gephyrin-like molybdotransferase Glp [Gallionella sp.]
MEYLTLNAAQQCILQHITTLGVEQVKLEASLGRVLAEQVRSNRDHPPYDVSAMDGYAVRAADLQHIPAILVQVEDIKAGAMPTMAVLPGQCARIMTGAPIPQGADTVIRVEDTQASGTVGSGGYKVQINQPAKLGADIRLRGENLRNGAEVFEPGVEITPGVLGILAMAKRAQVAVYRQPRVAILSNGDELEGLDEPFDANKIPDANSYTLLAQVQALGIEPVLLGIARDDPLELSQYIMRGLAFDVLLISGGTSVGVYDFVRSTIEALGIHMHFWRVAIRPGHPIAFGTTPESSVFCLPGNPVSSMVCFEQFVAPALRSQMGHRRIYRRTLLVRLAHDVKHRPGRTEFVRVTLSRDAAGYVATATGSQGSGVLMSMVHADSLLYVPQNSNGLAEGDKVMVQLLDGTGFQEYSGFQEDCAAKGKA